MTPAAGEGGEGPAALLRQLEREREDVQGRLEQLSTRRQSVTQGVAAGTAVRDELTAVANEIQAAVRERQDLEDLIRATRTILDRTKAEEAARAYAATIDTVEEAFRDAVRDATRLDAVLAEAAVLASRLRVHAQAGGRLVVGVEPRRWRHLQANDRGPDFDAQLVEHLRDGKLLNDGERSSAHLYEDGLMPLSVWLSTWTTKLVAEARRLAAAGDTNRQ